MPQRFNTIDTWARLPGTSISATLHLNQLTPRITKVVRDNLYNGICFGRGDASRVTRVLAEHLRISFLESYSGYININIGLVLDRPDPIGWLTQLEAILKVDRVRRQMANQVPGRHVWEAGGDIELVEKFRHWLHQHSLDGPILPTAASAAMVIHRSGPGMGSSFPSYLSASTPKGRRDLHRAMAPIRTKPEMQRLTAFLSDWKLGRITIIDLGTE